MEAEKDDIVRTSETLAKLEAAMTDRGPSATDATNPGPQLSEPALEALNESVIYEEDITMAGSEIPVKAEFATAGLGPLATDKTDTGLQGSRSSQKASGEPIERGKDITMMDSEAPVKVEDTVTVTGVQLNRSSPKAPVEAVRKDKDIIMAEPELPVKIEVTTPDKEVSPAGKLPTENIQSHLAQPSPTTTTGIGSLKLEDHSPISHKKKKPRVEIEDPSNPRKRRKSSSHAFRTEVLNDREYIVISDSENDRGEKGERTSHAFRTEVFNGREYVVISNSDDEKTGARDRGNGLGNLHKTARNILTKDEDTDMADAIETPLPAEENSTGAMEINATGEGRNSGTPESEAFTITEISDHSDTVIENTEQTELINVEAGQAINNEANQSVDAQASNPQTTLTSSPISTSSENGIIIDTRLPYRHGSPLLPVLPVMTIPLGARSHIPNANLVLQSIYDILKFHAIPLKRSLHDIYITHRFHAGSHPSKSNVTITILTDVSSNNKWVAALKDIRKDLGAPYKDISIEFLDHRVWGEGIFSLPISEVRERGVLRNAKRRQNAITNILNESGEEWTNLWFGWRGPTRLRAEMKATVVVSSPTVDKEKWWQVIFPKVKEVCGDKLEVELVFATGGQKIQDFAGKKKTVVKKE
ncbi:hypothetical protein GQ43DRAFT_500689 [Delitschia confertaspora ATCC 74209]|uniref:Uncharacterized protein n=1 Tax=Delitschia confertaspora ATCC 74209 TaxID=1513339 RepID=A0A9P4MMI0_9PLEO|nr:hypothetical protein GQ43DRAFT_500689 [Delitschia confertaspora ATCC 74209]